MAAKNKNSNKDNKKSISYVKIVLFLVLTISGGFSGLLFDKFDIKEKIIDLRYKIYNYFTSEPLKQYTAKDNQNIIVKFFSESDSAKDQQQQINQFENLKQYPPVRTLPAVTDYCHGFLAYGNPSYDVTEGLGQSDLYLCRDGYVVGYNYQTKEASWVAFKLTKSKVANKLKRDDKFKEDGDVLFVYRATLDDYSRSGYDRGHLASYASMDFSKKSADESFLLSNMSPQKAGLNRQGWERLETDERIWANMYDSIYVYTGPIYKKQKIYKTIGDNKIAVPDYFFKIIYVPSKNQAIAFVMPNARVEKTKIANYRVSIKDIEQRTGLHFLTNIQDRDSVINNVSSMWRTSYL
ncbi:DNA/RNA non-specific endonuclease [Francisella noatunensis]|uniref:Endonuclease n=1 Tax=Francisella noatunensis TaxID=657445 RepID=A0A9Q2KRM3_9GAMM|nr:DNA/RNA non-specific endonuclease [Francisella noatunensis]MBK2028243.1 DNA/RNA non-specific endonuclease [Francisella noatunensis]MBK2033573.1 DNA/RNA non-specific endonuclease [Francisella noatunensis]MBK2048474.1 DNA/RNA non-specific endonuclease [Francisella noatunensis]MBK2049954.1 DNA/RNA non-specific endonuclease [Francisella noatunensis]MBK2050885.1 DNA/RNA non-specific endonuclease [Francisella noatunensis]